jgi:hypothetical protein
LTRLACYICGSHRQVAIVNGDSICHKCQRSCLKMALALVAALIVGLWWTA